MRLCYMQNTTFHRLLALAFFVGLTFLLSLPAQALFPLENSSKPVEEVQLISSKELVATQSECTVEIDRIHTLIDKLKKDSDNEPSEYLLTELELWERLDLIAAQRESSLDDRTEIVRKQQLAKEQRLIAELTESQSQKPYSFLEFEDERDELLAAQQEKELLVVELNSEVAFLLEAKERLESGEQARRANNVLVSSDKEHTSELLREQTLLEIHSRVNRSEVALHREHSEVLKQRIELAEVNAMEMQGRIHSLAKRVVFLQEDLDQRLAQIAMVEQDIQDQLIQANHRLQQAIRNRSYRSSASTSGATLGSADSVLESAREEAHLLQQVLSEFSGIRECWRNRFHLANQDFESAELDIWLDDTQAAAQRLDHLIEKTNLRMGQRQNALAMLLRKKSVSDLNGEELLNLERQTVEMERLVDLYASTQFLTAGGQRLYRRFSNEVNACLNRRSWSEVAAGVGRWISTAWSYPIALINEQPITVSTITCGIMLLIAGYAISRLISSFIARVVLPKFGLGPTSIAPLRTVILYLLMIAFTFLALDIVNVPLTVFAFMGGAIAIGAGFGSQNLINNFISGLILLVERPIRIGDLVNVDGIEATIEKIGARSTTVRTGSNLDILVPNSKFLENNVTNWTLSDTQIRTSITIGVAYGSPVKSVLQILDSVVRSHPLVLQGQEPIVLFKDFGDNSLDFEVHFWIHMRRMMDCRRVESDLRVEIDDAFREHDITIAFPQRDVHLDFKAPIEVSLSDSALRSQTRPGPMRRVS